LFFSLNSEFLIEFLLILLYRVIKLLLELNLTLLYKP